MAAVRTLRHFFFLSLCVNAVLFDSHFVKTDCLGWLRQCTTSHVTEATEPACARQAQLRLMRSLQVKQLNVSGVCMDKSTDMPCRGINIACVHAPVIFFCFAFNKDFIQRHYNPQQATMEMCTHYYSSFASFCFPYSCHM